MAIERIKLSMELAERKAGLALRWLEVGIRGEKLIQMRTARREWMSALKTLKRLLRDAKKKADRWNRWLNSSEELVWGEYADPDRVAAGWRGLFCLIDNVDRGTQRTIAQMKQGDLPLIKVLKGFKTKRIAPGYGSESQESLYQVLEAIDIACAKEAGEHMAHVESVRAELTEMRSRHWKAQEVD
jgi:hypothetical protein